MRKLPSWPVALLGVAVALFGSSVVAAAFLLPERVDVYLTPSTRADVTYARWQFLALFVVGTGAIALFIRVIAGTVESLAEAFGTPPIDPTRLYAPMFSWLLATSTVALWAAVRLGNDEPVRRSWIELLLVLTGLGGALLLGVRAFRPREGQQGPPSRI